MKIDLIQDVSDRIPLIVALYFIIAILGMIFGKPVSKSRYIATVLIVFVISTVAYVFLMATQNLFTWFYS